MKKTWTFFCLLFCFATSSAKTPVEFVVPHSPGGVSDITARIIERGLPSGNYVIINKPGGGSQIAINYIIPRVAMLLATSTQVFVNNTYIFKDLSYNPEQDLEIIGTVGVIPSLLMCNKKTNIKQFKEILSTKRTLSFAIAGYGSNEHLVSELLFSMSKTTHQLVPFSAGGNAGIVAVIGGHVDCIFANLPTALPFVADPNLVLLVSSHDIEGISVKTWKQELNRIFPLQSYLVVAVSAKLDTWSKNQIKKDLARALTSSTVSSSLESSGLFVQAGTDTKNIQQAMIANQQAHKFIQTNNIDLKGK